MTQNIENGLIEIVKKQEWLMQALRDVRELRLLDWYIGGGAIRNTVWNVLHGYSGNANKSDVDIVYFDLSDREGLKEKGYEKELKLKNYSLNWEVVNQARLDLNSFRPNVNSSSDSMAYWSETATCVGVRIEENNSLTICAPHGLDDLMGLIVRPVPKPYRDIKLFWDRLREKKWRTKWPELKLVF